MVKSTRPERRRAVLVAVAFLTTASIAGCYRGTARSISASDVGKEPGWMLVNGLQLIPQTAERECGAAALAMMLRHWSIPVSKDEVWKAVSADLDPERGIPAAALRDFVRQKGLQAYLIVGEMTDLKNEVAQNRPVLVGLIQRHGERGIPHYVVVAGMNPTTQRLLLLDPAQGLREDTFVGFATEWVAAGRPTLVIVSS